MYACAFITKVLEMCLFVNEVKLSFIWIRTNFLDIETSFNHVLVYHLGWEWQYVTWVDGYPILYLSLSLEHLCHCMSNLLLCVWYIYWWFACYLVSEVRIFSRKKATFHILLNHQLWVGLWDYIGFWY